MKFVIPGEPVGKARPVVTRNGHAFTPVKTVLYENLVKTEYQRQCGNVYMTGAVRAEITAYYAIAKSDSKAKQAAKLNGALRPQKKPDCDNVGKGILDALNGVAYKDDSQVVELVVEKYYAAMPRVEVELKEVTAE